MTMTSVLNLSPPLKYVEVSGAQFNNASNMFQPFIERLASYPTRTDLALSLSALTPTQESLLMNCR